MLRKYSRSQALATAFFIGLSTPLSLQAMTPGWYVGAGYGASRLDPTVPFDIYQREDGDGEMYRGFFGYDFNELSSLELNVSELGEASLSNGDTVTYRAADVAGLYRFYDYQDAHGPDSADLNLFARLGLGYLDLESDTTLDPESRIHMLAGVGAELRVLGPLGLRADLEFFDADAVAASLSLFMRFGRSLQTPHTMPVSSVPASAAPVRTAEPAPSVPEPAVQAKPVSTPAPAPVLPAKPPQAAPAPTPAPVARVSDADADGVPDDRDRCTASRPGYPVRADGCPLFKGVLSGLKFSGTRTALNADEEAVLRGLASLLKKYPAATVELRAFSSASPREQVARAITRARLKNIGVFLRKAGVPARQTRFLAFANRDQSSGLNPERIEIRETDPR
ncbi:outer membrane beta-barrel protein [Granulosicoccaceae sp. 1_MG-2023]|nr:outer membrane beta-barrel protein [Granulosicoccaceae sp. 1_MG-2023]